MKKIIIKSCFECENNHVGYIDDNLTTVCCLTNMEIAQPNVILTNCPLDDDEMSIPVSKIRERIDRIKIDRINSYGMMIGQMDYAIAELESLIGEEEGEK